MSTNDGAEVFGADWGPPPGQGSGDDKRPANPAARLWNRIKQAFAPVVAFLAVVIKLKSVLFLGSMAISIAAYAQLWGWKFAVGFVGLILVHELGHAISVLLRGERVSALVFLPLLGAFTAYEPTERRPYADALTSLAGPFTGTLASFALAWYGHASGSQLLRALAFTGLLLNLFNLIPLLPLDGGSVARLTYPWVWAVLGVGLVGYLIVRPKPLVVVLLLLVGYELYSQLRHPDAHDRADVKPRQRLQLSLAYLALVVVIVVGMHATYTARTLN